MICERFRTATLAFVALACVAGYGAELSDLTARLKELDGKSTIHAAVHIEDRTSRTEDKATKPLEKADFAITADANTLKVEVTGEISDSRVLKEFSLFRAGELAHYAPHLAEELDGLELMENRVGSYHGIACRHWRLKSEKKEKKSGVSATTVRDIELWIDADGYPLAGLFKTRSKGRLLLFGFEVGSVRTQRYQRIGARLVLALDRNETDAQSKAGDEKRMITTTVEVRKD